MEEVAGGGVAGLGRDGEAEDDLVAGQRDDVGALAAERGGDGGGVAAMRNGDLGGDVRRDQVGGEDGREPRGVELPVGAGKGELDLDGLGGGVDREGEAARATRDGADVPERSGRLERAAALAKGDVDAARHLIEAEQRGDLARIAALDGGHEVAEGAPVQRHHLVEHVGGHEAVAGREHQRDVALAGRRIAQRDGGARGQVVAVAVERDLAAVSGGEGGAGRSAVDVRTLARAGRDRRADGEVAVAEAPQDAGPSGAVHDLEGEGADQVRLQGLVAHGEGHGAAPRARVGEIVEIVGLEDAGDAGGEALGLKGPAAAIVGHVERGAGAEARLDVEEAVERETHRHARDDGHREHRRVELLPGGLDEGDVAEGDRHLARADGIALDAVLAAGGEDPIALDPPLLEHGIRRPSRRWSFAGPRFSGAALTGGGYGGGARVVRSMQPREPTATAAYMARQRASIPPA